MARENGQFTGHCVSEERVVSSLSVVMCPNRAEFLVWAKNDPPRRMREELMGDRDGEKICNLVVVMLLVLW